MSEIYLEEDSGNFIRRSARKRFGGMVGSSKSWNAIVDSLIRSGDIPLKGGEYVDRMKITDRGVVFYIEKRTVEDYGS